ncbi:MAG: AAA family ATPase [Candidatus Limnocylindria bacterium]|nr:AAA family ATPase [Candidatus Limnocylindria bacterium]
MRIERVVARTFGPFRDRVLDLAPGMTVIGGPNESGKSSLHAAIRAAVGGVRRARGGPTRAEAQFADRHRPWDRPEEWSVEATLLLADGRRVEIVQDLAKRVASRATDTTLGRDVSNEIIHDGAPDASRWLGLDREAFGATACVDQADILSVTERADSLREYLERAAATRGTDATAAEAIERLREFRRTAVGAEMATSRGPLRTAQARLAAAEVRVDAARDRHVAYLELERDLDLASTEYVAAARRVRALEAEGAAREADALGARAERATLLASRYAEAPRGIVARDDLTNRVAVAIAGWRDRPATAPLHGPTAGELSTALDRLAPRPADGARPHPGVERSPAGGADGSARRSIRPHLLAASALAAIGVIAFVWGSGGIAVPALVLAAGALVLAAVRRTAAGMGHARRGAAEAAALRVALDARRHSDTASAEIARRIRDAEVALREAADAAGLPADRHMPDELVSALDAWLGRRALAAADDERAVREWQELSGLLDGGSLQQLRDRVEAVRRSAQPPEGEAVADRPTVAGDGAGPSLADARAAAERWLREAEALRGRRDAVAASLPSVAEAEEELSRALGEVARVETLKDTIERTLALLGSAQERVHRDLAPILAGSLRSWLPAVTNGRYIDAAVDPADLAVKVKEQATGRWRDARLLSQGAREQIYLLLRVAMAQHLVVRGEVAPLILDEVLAQSDRTRAERLLTTLHALARERQVILFTHDETIVRWADERLRGPSDAVIRLDAV